MAYMDYVEVERGEKFRFTANDEVIKIEPVQGTIKYRIWYVHHSTPIRPH